MSQAALVIAAAVFAAATWGDVIARFAADRPSSEQWLKIEAALRSARSTEAGKKVLDELGIGDGHISELDYQGSGVEFRVAPISTWANVSPAGRQLFSSRPTRFVVIVDPGILSAPPSALAPVMVHELAHAADRRAAPTVEDGLAVTERRGYLAAVQTALELDLRDELPSARAYDGTVAALLFDLHQWMDVYNGVPKLANRYGAQHSREASKVDDVRARHPGIRAMIAHVALRARLDLPTGGFDPGPGQTPYQRGFYAKLDAEDEAFRVRLARQAAARAADRPARGGYESGRSPLAVPRVVISAAAVAAPAPSGPVAFAAPAPERPEATIDLDDLMASRAATAAQDACRGSASGLGMKWDRALAERALRPRLAGVADPCVRAVLEHALTRDALTDEDWAALIPRPAAPSARAAYNPCIDAGNTCLRRE